MMTKQEQINIHKRARDIIAKINDFNPADKTGENDIKKTG